MKALLLGLAFATFAGTAFSQIAPLELKQSVGTDTNGYTTRMLWRTNTVPGVFETKVTDKAGRVIQWDQHFFDSDGKEIMAIVRQTVGDLRPSYESIQLIIHFTYNADGNVLEVQEFYGDGEFRRRVVHRYGPDGKWLRGDVYNAAGRLVGRELTAPEWYLSAC